MATTVKVSKSFLNDYDLAIASLKLTKAENELLYAIVVLANKSPLNTFMRSSLCDIRPTDLNKLKSLSNWPKTPGWIGKYLHNLNKLNIAEHYTGRVDGIPVSTYKIDSFDKLLDLPTKTSKTPNKRTTFAMNLVAKEFYGTTFLDVIDSESTNYYGDHLVLSILDNGMRYSSNMKEKELNVTANLSSRGNIHIISKTRSGSRDELPLWSDQRLIRYLWRKIFINLRKQQTQLTLDGIEITHANFINSFTVDLQSAATEMKLKNGNGSIREAARQMFLRIYSLEQRIDAIESPWFRETFIPDGGEVLYFQLIQNLSSREDADELGLVNERYYTFTLHPTMFNIFVNGVIKDMRGPVGLFLQDSGLVSEPVGLIHRYMNWISGHLGKKQKDGVENKYYDLQELHSKIANLSRFTNFKRDWTNNIEKKARTRNGELLSEYEEKIKDLTQEISGIPDTKLEERNHLKEKVVALQNKIIEINNTDYNSDYRVSLYGYIIHMRKTAGKTSSGRPQTQKSQRMRWQVNFKRDLSHAITGENSYSAKKNKRNKQKIERPKSSEHTQSNKEHEETASDQGKSTFKTLFYYQLKESGLTEKEIKELFSEFRAEVSDSETQEITDALEECFVNNILKERQTGAFVPQNLSKSTRSILSEEGFDKSELQSQYEAWQYYQHQKQFFVADPEAAFCAYIRATKNKQEAEQVERLKGAL